jgi:hypothetical protein
MKAADTGNVRTLRAEMSRTALAVEEGHDAHLHRSLESTGWVRRGLLGRLVRVPSGAG